MSTGHIDADNASMSHSVIPGSHGMIFTNDAIIKFSYIASRIYAGNICLQVFIDDYTAPYLDRRMFEELRVYCDAQTDTDYISRHLPSFFGLYIPGNPVLQYYPPTFTPPPPLPSEFLPVITH